MLKRRFVALAILTVVAVATAVPILLAEIPSAPGPTKANFDKIQKGMTFEEVEAILGTDWMVFSEPPSNVRNMFGTRTTVQH